MLIKALLRAGLRACLAGLAIACAAIPALAADPIDDVAFNATISPLAADPVPEPMGLGLLGIGLLGLGFVRRR